MSERQDRCFCFSRRALGRLKTTDVVQIESIAIIGVAQSIPHIGSWGDFIASKIRIVLFSEISQLFITHSSPHIFNTPALAIMVGIFDAIYK